MRRGSHQRRVNGTPASHRCVRRVPLIGSAAFLLLLAGAATAGSGLSDEDAPTAQALKDVSALLSVRCPHNIPSLEGLRSLIKVIERLDGWKAGFPSFPQMDELLWLSGQAKSEAGCRAFRFRNEPDVKRFFEIRRQEYRDSFGELYYGGADFKRLIELYPDGELASKAAFVLAENDTRGGECESDMDCRVARSIGSFLPFLKAYPKSPEVRDAIEWINADSFGLLLDEKTFGQWDDPLATESGALIDEYCEAVTNLPDPADRALALYPLARAFIGMGRYDTADRIYQDLLANHGPFIDEENVSQAAARLLDHWRSPRRLTVESLDSNRPEQRDLDPDLQALEKSVREALRRDLSMRRTPDAFDLANALLTGSQEDAASAFATIKQLAAGGDPYVGPFDLLPGVMTWVADRMITDPVRTVRIRAIGLMTHHAPRTAFFQAAVLACTTRDPAVDIRYRCAVLLSDYQDKISREGVVRKAIDQAESDYRASRRSTPGSH